jgi:hypothetical protein
MLYFDEIQACMIDRQSAAARENNKFDASAGRVREAIV